MIDKNLRFLRKLNNYSQEMVAEKLNVSRQAVSKWENGETFPDIINCIALADLYNVTLDNLVKYEDNHNNMFIPPKGKHFFGMFKVEKDGYIGIPLKAREIFNINEGDDVFILGDEDSKGIAIVKSDGIESFAKSLLDVAESLKEE